MFQGFLFRVFLLLVLRFAVSGFRVHSFILWVSGFCSREFVVSIRAWGEFGLCGVHFEAQAFLLYYIFFYNCLVLRPETGKVLGSRDSWLWKEGFQGQGLQGHGFVASCALCCFGDFG